MKDYLGGDGVLHVLVNVHWRAVAALCNIATYA